MEGSHNWSLSMGRNMPGGFCCYYLTSIFSLRSAQNRKRLVLSQQLHPGIGYLKRLFVGPGPPPPHLPLLLTEGCESKWHIPLPSTVLLLFLIMKAICIHYFKIRKYEQKKSIEIHHTTCLRSKRGHRADHPFSNFPCSHLSFWCIYVCAHY